MYHIKEIFEIEKQFNSDKTKGLTSSMRQKNREKYGANQFKKKKSKSVFSSVFEAMMDPMVLILLLAFIVTLGVNIGKYLSVGQGSFYESAGIFIAIFISVFLTVFMEGRSKKAFEMLKKISDNIAVTVICDGKKNVVKKEEIVVGDVIELEAGEKVLADGRIIECNNLSVDESTLTGESGCVEKTAKLLKSKVPLAERKNMLYSGTFIVSGYAKYMVTAVGEQSEIGKIATDLGDKAVISAPLTEKLKRLSKTISVIGLISALFVFVLSVIRLKITNEINFFSVQDLFIQSIVLIVAAVPEGLPSTLAISLSLNVIKLAKSNALIKKLVATETVGCVSVICSDKTGTLTENKMTVKTVWYPDKKARSSIMNNIFHNSTAELDTQSGSKTELALLAYLKQEKVEFEKTKIINRTPFSSEIKYMATEIEQNGKKICYYKGAPEVIARFCKIPVHAEQKINEYESMSLRVIAFCHSLDGRFVFDGFSAITDKLRSDVRSSIESCKNAGITVKILTGDNAKTAQAIANELGLYGKVLSGDEIEKMSPERLRAQIRGVAIVARSTPLAKLKVVKALQELGEVVAVTGDGVNDAPAIKRADIGIAMGSGSEITKEAGDVILLDNSFSTIVKAITFGRNVFCNFQRFLSFQLTVNLSSMCIIIAFLVLGFECPFSSTCLLWLNVIMDGPLAISLGLENRSVDLAQVGPTRRKDDILSPKLLARILVHSLFIGFVVSMQKIYNFLAVPTSESSTVVFVLFVLMQLFNALNCREIRTKSVFFDFFGNKLLIVMCVITFLLQIIIISCFPQFFASTPLSSATWIKVIITASTLLWFAEGYKLILRNFKFRKTTLKKYRAVNNG